MTDSISDVKLDRASTERMSPLRVHTKIEEWPLAAPFHIAGFTFHSMALLSVRLESRGECGKAEASGVYYRNETAESMSAQIDSVRPALEAGVSRAELRTLLAPGGARNALDCALWELQARLAGVRVWQLAQLVEPRPLLTSFTCGADTPANMAATARGYRGARAIKLKLTGEPLDAARVEEVRCARPDVWLGVDANQGFSRGSLETLMPILVEQRVQLIEQPFPAGEDALLDGFQSPIPVAADESVQSLSDLQERVGRFQAVNIKLDKCGGLTEALAMVHAARALGFMPMVGNMLGTSLSMAPAFILGQICDFADLDGAVFLREDRTPGLAYRDGLVSCPESLWG